jgi:hypothetical protein
MQCHAKALGRRYRPVAGGLARRVARIIRARLWGSLGRRGGGGRTRQGGSGYRSAPPHKFFPQNQCLPTLNLTNKAQASTMPVRVCYSRSQEQSPFSSGGLMARRGCVWRTSPPTLTYPPICPKLAPISSSLVQKCLQPLTSSAERWRRQRMILRLPGRCTSLSRWLRSTIRPTRGRSWLRP